MKLIPIGGKAGLDLFSSYSSVYIVGEYQIL